MDEVNKGCLMTRMGMSGRMFLLVASQPVGAGQRAAKRLFQFTFTRLYSDRARATVQGRCAVHRGVRRLVQTAVRRRAQPTAAVHRRQPRLEHRTGLPGLHRQTRRINRGVAN